MCISIDWLKSSSSQILGSVIFMDNHHLKLILHRTIYVVWLTNDDHLLQKVKGKRRSCQNVWTTLMDAYLMLMLLNEFVITARSYLTNYDVELGNSNTTKLIPAWFTSTRGAYLNHIQKLPISSSQIVGSVIFMGNHHQDLKYSCVVITSWKGWNPVRQLMPSTQLE